MSVDSDEAEEQFHEKKKKKMSGPRRKKGTVLYRVPETGELLPLPPTMSSWYVLYCSSDCQDLTPNFESKFRRRFRLPYNEYNELVQLCIEESEKLVGYFRRWKPGTKAADGSISSPIELLVLTSLRYLGRGWTFDDLEECTAISEEVIRSFFHQFIAFGANCLFPKYVCVPNLTDIHTTVQEYSLAGFAGCVGSMDASHVEHSRISYKHRQAHLSFKLPFTARTYNLVCNHRRRIFCTTEGHPARWNDKSLVRFDLLAAALHEGSSALCDLEFELYAYDGEEVIKEKYKGGWLLVDNGYLNWGVTVPPLKESNTMAEWRFSKWLESMRKDVECTFGILKGRWRVLKAGIRVHGTEAADNIWKTCCALHNWLLEIDGIAEDYSSDWLGDLGTLAASDMPEPMRRLLTNNAIPLENYDASAMGKGNDAGIEEEADEEDNEEEVFQGSVVVDEASKAIVVRKMSMLQYRQRLVTHFDICFKKKELHWPKQRIDKEEPTTTY
jgi:hypothetical protein